MPISIDPWEIVGYDAVMFRVERQIWNQQPHLLSTLVLRNATVESGILHARILCDILLSRTSAKDDMRLTELFVPGIAEPVADKIDTNLISQLSKDYGNSATPGSPCWEFNKML